jgi:hypothetical protein
MILSSQVGGFVVIRLSEKWFIYAAIVACLLLLVGIEVTTGKASGLRPSWDRQILIRIVISCGGVLLALESAGLVPMANSNVHRLLGREPEKKSAGPAPGGRRSGGCAAPVGFIVCRVCEKESGLLLKLDGADCRRQEV